MRMRLARAWVMRCLTCEGPTGVEVVPLEGDAARAHLPVEGQRFGRPRVLQSQCERETCRELTAASMHSVTDRQGLRNDLIESSTLLVALPRQHTSAI